MTEHLEPPVTAAKMGARTRLPQLDGLRGVAILLVVWWHYFNCGFAAQGKWPWLIEIAEATDWTWAGVDLFFTLSGFLITGVLLDEAGARNLMPVFYVRRAARILPLYWATLAACAVAWSLIGQDPRFAPLFSHFFPIWSYLTFTQNILMGRQGFGGKFLGVTWSLAIEEQFYLVWPWIVRFSRSRRTLGIVCGCLVIAAPLLRFWGTGLERFVGTLFRVDSLIFGALAALIVRNNRASDWANRLGERKMVTLAAGMLLLGRNVAHWDILVAWKHSCFGLTSFGILLAATNPASKTAKTLSFPLLQWFGKISFALYLTHEVVHGLLFGWLANRYPAPERLVALAITASCFLLSVMLAGISARWFEPFFLRLGQRCRYQH